MICQRIVNGKKCRSTATYVATGAKGGKTYLCTKHFKALGKTIARLKTRD